MFWLLLADGLDPLAKVVEIGPEVVEIAPGVVEIPLEVVEIWSEVVENLFKVVGKNLISRVFSANLEVKRAVRMLFSQVIAGVAGIFLNFTAMG